MMTVLELIHLYGEINQEIISKNYDNVSRHFVSVTQILKKI